MKVDAFTPLWRRTITVIVALILGLQAMLSVADVVTPVSDDTVQIQSSFHIDDEAPGHAGHHCCHCHAGHTLLPGALALHVPSQGRDHWLLPKGFISKTVEDPFRPPIHNIV